MTGTSAPLIIQVSGLTKRFKNKVAVNNISFAVAKGSCFGLLGPNGAGKTTTIEMLEGMLPRDAGEVVYDGQPFDKHVRQRIGIQFQHTALQDYLTTRETIELFRALYPAPLSTEHLIELCNLTEFSEQDHRKLSGGQKQRLLLALALVNDPDIVFLDEPTTGLDPHARRNFWQLVEEIKAQGKTIILTTHYMDEAEQLCDDIVIMDKGEVIERGNPKQLLLSYFPGVLIRLAQQPWPPMLAAHYQPRQKGQYIEFSTTSTATTMRQLVESGIDLEDMQVKSANLDDLFLKLTGHKLRESNA